MHITNIHEAKTHLSSLIKQALAGEEVIIARANQPLVKLVPVQLDTSPRVGGQWAGKVIYNDTWEQMDKEIQELFEDSTIFPSENK